MSIRAATASDVEAILALEAAAFADPWTRAQVLAELAQPRSVVLLAFADPEVAAGYVALRHGGGEGEILRLAVAPQARRRGVATALVREGLVRLVRAGAGLACLEVRADNRAATAFYQGLGFARAGRRRTYYRDGCDALVLSRLIP
jgi:ribosomal-protein-alanine N-acetyltransferase